MVEHGILSGGDSLLVIAAGPKSKIMTARTKPETSLSFAKRVLLWATFS